MQMRMLANCVFPYHRIMSDAVLREEKTSYDCNQNFLVSILDACGTKLILYILPEIYESETWDMQVDGSLILVRNL